MNVKNLATLTRKLRNQISGHQSLSVEFSDEGLSLYSSQEGGLEDVEKVTAEPESESDNYELRYIGFRDAARKTFLETPNGDEINSQRALVGILREVEEKVTKKPNERGYESIFSITKYGLSYTEIEKTFDFFAKTFIRKL